MLEASQIPEMQSAVTLQVWLEPQRRPQVPPQSVSPSVWFLMPSKQETQMPAAQLPRRQSAPMLQVMPSAQLLPQRPPQSTPVSLPLSTASVQVGAAQKPLWETVVKRMEVLVLVATALFTPAVARPTVPVAFSMPCVRATAPPLVQEVQWMSAVLVVSVSTSWKVAGVPPKV